MSSRGDESNEFDPDAIHDWIKRLQDAWTEVSAQGSPMPSGVWNQGLGTQGLSSFLVQQKEVVEEEMLRSGHLGGASAPRSGGAPLVSELSPRPMRSFADKLFDSPPMDTPPPVPTSATALRPPGSMPSPASLRLPPPRATPYGVVESGVAEDGAAGDVDGSDGSDDGDRSIAAPSPDTRPSMRVCLGRNPRYAMMTTGGMPLLLPFPCTTDSLAARKKQRSLQKSTLSKPRDERSASAASPSTAASPGRAAPTPTASSPRKKRRSFFKRLFSKRDVDRSKSRSRSPGKKPSPSSSSGAVDGDAPAPVRTRKAVMGYALVLRQVLGRREKRIKGLQKEQKKTKDRQRTELERWRRFAIADLCKMCELCYKLQLMALAAKIRAEFNACDVLEREINQVQLALQGRNKLDAKSFKHIKERGRSTPAEIQVILSAHPEIKTKTELAKRMAPSVDAAAALYDSMRKRLSSKPKISRAKRKQAVRNLVDASFVAATKSQTNGNKSGWYWHPYDHKQQDAFESLFLDERTAEGRHLRRWRDDRGTAASPRSNGKPRGGTSINDVIILRNHMVREALKVGFPGEEPLPHVVPALALYTDRMLFPRIRDIIEMTFTEREREEDARIQLNQAWATKLSPQGVGILPNLSPPPSQVQDTRPDTQTGQKVAIYPRACRALSGLSIDSSPSDALHCLLKALKTLHAEAAEYAAQHETIKEEAIKERSKGQQADDAPPRNSKPEAKTMRRLRALSNHKQRPSVGEGKRVEGEASGDAESVVIDPSSAAVPLDQAEKSDEKSDEKSNPKHAEKSKTPKKINLDADSLFPLVMWVLIHSKVPRLLSILGTISRFSDPAVTTFGETGMALALAEAAASHLSNMTQKRDRARPIGSEEEGLAVGLDSSRGSEGVGPESAKLAPGGGTTRQIARLSFDLAEAVCRRCGACVPVKGDGLCAACGWSIKSKHGETVPAAPDSGAVVGAEEGKAHGGQGAASGDQEDPDGDEVDPDV